MTDPGVVGAVSLDLDATEHLPSGGFGWPTLTLLGASFTAAGCYAPWSLGIDAAGWPGMLIAFALVGLFYFCLMQCLAEMSSAIPSSGAGQAFAREAFGPAAGFIAGATAIVQWVSGVAALAVLLSIYVGQLTGLGTWATVIFAYCGLVGVLLTGAEEAVGATVVISLVALAGIAFFISATGMHVHGGSFAALRSTPVHLHGIWLALPFSVTFFLGLEGVPFASEEADNPERNVPIGLLSALSIVAAFGALVLLFGPAGAGLDILKGSGDPILAGLSASIIGVPSWTIMAINLAAIAGLTVSLFSGIYACSRQVFAMARDRELPHWFSHLNRKGAPAPALIVPSIIGAVLAMSGAIDRLIVIMVFSSCLSYLLMFASFLGLRLRRRDLAGPYRVRFSGPVAGVGITLGIVIFAACIATDLVWSTLGGLMLLTLLAYRVVASRFTRKNTV